MMKKQSFRVFLISAAQLAAAVALAGSFSACSGTSTSAARAFESLGKSRADIRETEVLEKTYSIIWREKAEGTKQRPYNPVELASPAADLVSGLIFTATRDGYLTAFSARDKNRVWEKKLDGPFNAGPILDNGTLYIASAAGKVAAMDPVTGESKWVYEMKEAFTTQPVLAGGLLLVMNTDDTLIALDASDGTWKWQYKRDLPANLTLFGSARPAVKDSSVFAGFADGTAVALDLSTGALIWEKELSTAKAFRDIDASPLIDDSGNVIFASTSDGVFSLNAETGDILWSHSRKGITSIALNSEKTKLFIGGHGFIGSFGAEDGKMKWGRDLRSGTSVTAISVTNGQILASCGAEPMHFLEEETGRVRREFQPGYGVTAQATVTEDGDVLVLSNRGYLYVMAIHP